MGNSQPTSRRNLQHTFPFLHNYRKLPPSSTSPTRPLLDIEEYDVQDSSLAEPYCMWSSKKQERDFEDFMKKTGAIEKDISNLKSSLSKLQSWVVSFTSEQSSLSKKVKDQGESAMREMSRRVSNLEHKLPSNERMTKQENVIEKSNTATGTTTATATAMEKKIAELEETVHGLKTMISTYLHERTASSKVIVDRRFSTPMDDLIGILLVLIFLMSILIGINL